MDVAEMKRLYVEEEWTLRRIAAAAGMSKPTVTKRLRGAGVRIRGSREVALRAVLRIDRAELLALYGSGLSADQVAAHFGVSQPTILGAIRNAGGTVRMTSKDLGEPPPGTLWCLGCKGAFPPDHFHTSRSVSRGKTTRCKGCVQEDHFIRKYGLGREAYQTLLAAQGGRCAICRRDDVSGPGRGFATLHVDHCHATGRVRGLLCGQCNAGLGSFRDNRESLARAIEYLNGDPPVLSGRIPYRVKRNR